jgi:hypothetical protein
MTKIIIIIIHHVVVSRWEHGNEQTRHIEHVRA